MTKREQDGRFAFVDESALGVHFDPLPEGPALAELLDLAERDCFVGAWLQARAALRVARERRGGAVRVLVLGGTRFLGPHLVEAALGRGHKVTLFNRGARPVASPRPRETPR